MKKRIVRYCGLAALLAGAALFLPCCDGNGTGPEPYDGPWEVVPCPEGPSYLNAVFFLNPNLGYAVGCRHILKYDGSEWKVDFAYKETSERYSIALYDVWFNASDDGWVVGSEWDNEKRESIPLILHYDGKYWTRVVAVLPSDGFRALYFLTPEDGWAAGMGIAHWDGDSWNYVADIGFLTGIFFNTPNDGWAISYYGPKIYHYDGVTWEKVYEQSMHRGYAVAFTEPGRGWACSGRTMMMEYKDGKWGEYVVEGMLYEPFDIHFLSPTCGWACGNWTYKWDGEKWNFVKDPVVGGPIYGVFTVSEEEAWAVGGGRLIMHYQPKNGR